MSGKNDKIKNLNVTELKKKAKELSKQKEETVKDIHGDEYNIKIDEFFRKSKIHKLLEDLIDFMNETRNNEELVGITTVYTSLLLIKHFTNLSIPDDIDGSVDMLYAITDLELLDEILNVLPEEEVEKVYNQLKISTERMNANLDELLKEAGDLDDKIDNKEVKDFINGKAKDKQ